MAHLQCEHNNTAFNRTFLTSWPDSSMLVWSWATFKGTQKCALERRTALRLTSHLNELSGWWLRGHGSVRIFRYSALMHFEAQGLQIPVLIKSITHICCSSSIHTVWLLSVRSSCWWSVHWNVYDHLCSVTWTSMWAHLPGRLFICWTLTWTILTINSLQGRPVCAVTFSQQTSLTIVCRTCCQF